jgi:hypothetical protein
MLTPAPHRPDHPTVRSGVITALLCASICGCSQPRDITRMELLGVGHEVRSGHPSAPRQDPSASSGASGDEVSP